MPSNHSRPPLFRAVRPIFMLVTLTIINLMFGTLVIFAQTPGDAGVGDPYFPQLGNGGYEAQHYTINLSFEVEANTLEGTVRIDAVAAQDLSRFNLDFQALEVD